MEKSTNFVEGLGEYKLNIPLNEVAKAAAESLLESKPIRMASALTLAATLASACAGPMEGGNTEVESSATPTPIVERATETPMATEKPGSLDDYLAKIYPEMTVNAPEVSSEVKEFWNDAFIPKFYEAGDMILANADQVGNNDGVDTPGELELWKQKTKEEISEFEALKDEAEAISPEMGDLLGYYVEMFKHQADRVTAMREGKSYDEQPNEYSVDKVLPAFRAKYGTVLSWERPE